MEQKVIEKINSTVELINNKIDANTETLKLLYVEVFTKDVMQMVDATGFIYYYPISKDRMLCINPENKRICITDENKNVTSDFHVNHLSDPKNYYDNWSIRHLEQTAKMVLRHEQYLKTLNELAPEIIDDITDKYREATEEQEGKLDDILKMLDVDVTPTRRIRVTIEWI